MFVFTYQVPNTDLGTRDIAENKTTHRPWQVGRHNKQMHMWCGQVTTMLGDKNVSHYTTINNNRKLGKQLESDEGQ